MSHMSTRSKKILEKMKMREQNISIPKNHTESSELVINDRYNPLRFKGEARSNISNSVGKRSSHKSSLLLSGSRFLGSQGSPYKLHREMQEKPTRSVEDKTSSQSSPFQRSNLRESYLSKAYRSRSKSN